MAIRRELHDILNNANGNGNGNGSSNGTKNHTEPHHGYTRWGHPVHAQTIEHLPNHTRYNRWNKKVATWLTDNIGTMTCFWLFTIVAVTSLPATLKYAGIMKSNWVFPTFTMTYGFIVLIQWVSSAYFQFVLLPGLMVGQNLQNVASDVRAMKQFELTHTIEDRLNLETEGGIADLLAAVRALEARLELLAEHTHESASPPPE